MKKWITILLAAVLMICLLAGCQNSDSSIDQSTLTQEQRDAISAAYKDSESLNLYWYHTDGLGAYYLGEVEGCIIFYNLRTWNSYVNIDFEYKDNLTWYLPGRYRLCEFTLLGIPFSPAFENQLFAYKDGEVCWLTKAWAKGWISKDGAQQVKEAYDVFIQHLIDMGEDNYLKREKQLRTLQWEEFGGDWNYQSYQNFMELTESTEYQMFISQCKKQTDEAESIPGRKTE